MNKLGDKENKKAVIKVEKVEHSDDCIKPGYLKCETEQDEEYFEVYTGEIKEECKEECKEFVKEEDTPEVNNILDENIHQALSNPHLGLPGEIFVLAGKMCKMLVSL